MRYTYRTEGVCAPEVSFDIDDGVVSNIAFTGGCEGNLKALAILAEGLAADQIVTKLSGNTCDDKPTSCADQFARAVREATARTGATLPRAS